MLPKIWLYTFTSSSTENYHAGHALFLSLFNFSVSSVTDVKLSPYIQRAEWLGWDLQDSLVQVPSSSPFAGGKASCCSWVAYFGDIS